MWEFRRNNMFAATALSSYGGFWLSYGIYLILAAGGVIPESGTEGLQMMLSLWGILTFFYFCKARCTAVTCADKLLSFSQIDASQHRLRLRFKLCLGYFAVCSLFQSGTYYMVHCCVKRQKPSRASCFLCCVLQLHNWAECSSDGLVPVPVNHLLLACCWPDQHQVLEGMSPPTSNLRDFPSSCCCCACASLFFWAFSLLHLRLKTNLVGQHVWPM